MPYLVDGHNLIGQMHNLSLSDPDDEDKLIEHLRIVADRAHKRITVVFDPNPHDRTPPIGGNSTQHGRVTVIFAHPGRKADDVIRRIVSDTRDKQGLIVITSDAAVADFTRRCGIKVQSSSEFDKWAQLQLAGKHNPNAKPLGGASEVINWAEVFKEPEPPPEFNKPPQAPPMKKKPTRSEQLKQQVKRIRPLK